MLELLREVEKIAGTVSPEVLRNVAAQIQVLVAPRTSVDPHSTLETSPMVPHRHAYRQGDSRELLNSADGAASAASGQQSTDGSSMPGDSDDSENMDELSEEEEAVVEAFDQRQWLGGPPMHDEWFGMCAGVFDESSNPRLGDDRGRDSIGLARHGRVMYCVYHDLNGESQFACMAEDMLQQTRISKLIKKLQAKRRRKPLDDQDGRGARYACYRAVISWQWANPLGAENRVRLPWCVLYRVRQLFPNPCCDAAKCDYGLVCEKQGHYTGFRTVEESRAIREGRAVCIDCT